MEERLVGLSAAHSRSGGSALLNGNGTASSPGAVATPRHTALSNRLNTVLSSSYTDSDIRDALETLDIRGIENTVETRRNLRLDVQKDVLDSNGKIIQDFGKIAEKLSHIGDVIANLKTTCEDMRRHLALAHQETGPVLEEASTLTAQKEEVEIKQLLLDAFDTHFILSDEDTRILTSQAEPVDDGFFRVLERAKQIHKDCEVLLGTENQRMGLEIMEQSSRNINSAFVKVHEWIQKVFVSLNLEDPHINSSIRRALRVLAERPSLFHACIDSFADSREYILSGSFHHALTTAHSAAGNDTASKPIEFSAHDPLRYVGDMLAWVHSAAVSEREALEALFVSDADDLAKGMETGMKSEPWTRVDSQETVFDGHKALRDLVTRDLSGVARSLLQRVKLSIQGHEDPVTIYKMMNLLIFYETTFSKLVGTGSALVETMISLKQAATKRFEFLFEERLSTLTDDPASLAPPADLSAPEYLVENLDTLSSLFEAFGSSMRSEPVDKDMEEDISFTSIIRIALDPFLELSESSAKSLTNPLSKAVFRTNYLLSVRSTLSSFDDASTTKLSSLTGALSELRTELHEIQHKFFLEKSGLQTLLDVLAPFTPAATGSTETSAGTSTSARTPELSTISSLTEFQPEALSTISQQLDDFLPSALVDATDNLKLLQNPSLVKSVTGEAAEAFSHDFEFIESIILGADEANRSDNTELSVSSRLDSSERETGEKMAQGQPWSLRALFPRTTGEIQVLLS